MLISSDCRIQQPLGGTPRRIPSGLQSPMVRLLVALPNLLSTVAFRNR